MNRNSGEWGLTVSARVSIPKEKAKSYDEENNFSIYIFDLCNFLFNREVK